MEPNNQVDEQAALAALDGEVPLLQQLGTMFCEDAEALLEELENAVEAKDAQACRRAFHSIKGKAVTFFAQPTVDLAHQLEMIAAQGDLERLTGEPIDRLRQHVQALVDEIKHRGWLATET